MERLVRIAAVVSLVALFVLAQDPANSSEDCNSQLCVKKCCPKGSLVDYNSLNMTAKTFSCHVTDKEFRPPVNGSDYQIVIPKPEKDEECSEGSYAFISHFSPFINIDQDSMTLEDDSTSPYFCIDLFYIKADDKDSRLDVLFCLNPDQVSRAEKLPDDRESPGAEALHLPSNICMLISSVFFALTLIAYATLPHFSEKKHAPVFMTAVSFMLVAYTVSSTIALLNDYYTGPIPKDAKGAMVLVTYFSLMSMFCWLNVIGHDHWLRMKNPLSSLNPISSKQLKRYCVFAIGVPTVLTALVATFQYLEWPNKVYYPNIADTGTFMIGAARMLYFNAPVFFLYCVNLVFFIHITRKLYRDKKEAKENNNGADSRVNNNKKENSFRNYLKLSVSMGISWISEMIVNVVEVFDETQPYWYLWIIFDLYNQLFGVVVFILFIVQTDNIWTMVKDRWRNKASKRTTRIPSQVLRRKRSQGGTSNRGNSSNLSSDELETTPM